MRREDCIVVVHIEQISLSNILFSFRSNCSVDHLINHFIERRSFRTISDMKMLDLFIDRSLIIESNGCHMKCQWFRLEFISSIHLIIGEIFGNRLRRENGDEKWIDWTRMLFVDLFVRRRNAIEFRCRSMINWETNVRQSHQIIRIFNMSSRESSSLLKRKSHSSKKWIKWRKSVSSISLFSEQIFSVDQTKENSMNNDICQAEFDSIVLLSHQLICVCSFHNWKWPNKRINRTTILFNDRSRIETSLFVLIDYEKVISTMENSDQIVV